VRSLEWQNIPPTELSNAEVVILGGATTSFSTAPSVDLSEEGDRILYGAQLYRQKKAPINCCRWSH